MRQLPITFHDPVRAVTRRYARQLGLDYQPPRIEWLAEPSGVPVRVREDGAAHEDFWLSSTGRVSMPARTGTGIRPQVWLTQPWEAWVELPLSPEWTVAYFLVDQDGTPRVAEVRIFPTEPHKERPRGQWSGSVLGVKAQVPHGGLPARLLRRVRIAQVFKATLTRLRAVAHPLYRDQYVTVFVPRRRPASASAEKGPRRGRPRRPDADFVRFAADYAGAIRRGDDRPIEAVAKHHRLTVVQVRALIHKARVRGLLGDAPGWGVAGGELTPRGRALLAALRRSQKPKSRRTRR